MMRAMSLATLGFSAIHTIIQGAKVLQTERNTKEKIDFLWISEVPPPSPRVKITHFTSILQKSRLKICRIQKKALILHPLSDKRLQRHTQTFRSENTGEMVEWSITVVLKTTVPRGTGGSNPSLSAHKFRSPLIFSGFFISPL